MAVDTLFDYVPLLVQGGSLTNQATIADPYTFTATGGSVVGDHIHLNPSGGVLEELPLSYFIGWDLQTTDVVSYEAAVNFNSWSAGVVVLSGKNWHVTAGLSTGSFTLHTFAESVDFEIAITGKVHFLLVHDSRPSVQSLTLTITDVGGDTETHSATLTTATYGGPFIVGSDVAVDVAVPAADIMATPATITQGYPVTAVPQYALLTVNTGGLGTPSSGSAVVYASKPGASHSYTISNVAGMTGAAMASALAVGIAALIGGSASATGYGSAQVTTFHTSTTDTDWAYSIVTSIQYPIGTVAGQGSVSYLQTGIYGASPGLATTKAIYLTITNAVAYAQLNLTLGTNSNSFVLDGVTMALDALDAWATGLGYIVSWALTTPGNYVIQIASSGPGDFGMTTSLTVSSIYMTPSDLDLYAMRITKFRREDVGYPTLPWPTSSIPENSDPSVLGSGVLFAANGEGNYRDVSIYARAPSFYGDGTHMSIIPDTSRTDDSYMYNDTNTWNEKTGVYYSTSSAANALWRAATAMTIEFDIKPPTRTGTEYGNTYMMVFGSSVHIYFPVGHAEIGAEALGSGSVHAEVAYNVWSHVAMVADAMADTLDIYVNGTLQHADALIAPFFGPSGSDLPNISLFQVVGREDLASFKGGLDNIVLTVGKKYTANFTPPTTGVIPAVGAVPATVRYYYPFETGNTSPVANQGSLTTHTMALEGVATATSGGGVVGVGRGSRVTPNAAFAQIMGDYTVMAWVYEKVSENHDLFSAGTDHAIYTVGGFIGLYTAGESTVTSAAAMVPNVWTHLAYIKTGEVGKLYKNGVAIVTRADITNPNGDLYGPRLGSDVGFSGIPTGTALEFDDLVLAVEALYTSDFTPPPRGSAFSGEVGPGPIGDVYGAGYMFLDDTESVGVGNEQGSAPNPYGSSASTLEDFFADQSLVIDNNSVNGTSARTLANFTNTGGWVAAVPTEMVSPDQTLEDFTSDSAGVATTPIDVAVPDQTLEDIAALLGIGMFLEPSRGSADVLLAEFTSTGAGETQASPTARVNVTMSMPTVYASGSLKTTDVAYVTMPKPVVASYGHGTAATTMPKAIVASTGTVVNIARVAAEMPMPTASATGRVAGSSTIQVTMPLAEMVGYGGGMVSATIDGFTTTFSVNQGTAGQITAEMPMVVVEATGFTTNTGQIEAIMPMLVPNEGGRITAVLPMVRVVATGFAVVAVTNEAYVLNLAKPLDDNPRNNFESKNDQMTRYTNFPFTQVVRYLDSYYGVAADGLYLLEGTTDNGAPLAWSFSTCVTDFGNVEKKTVASVYLGGQAGPDVDFIIKSGETPDQVHEYVTAATTVKRNYRQKFGKGRRTRYWALGLAGEGELALDMLEFEVGTMARRI